MIDLALFWKHAVSGLVGWVFVSLCVTARK